MHSARHLFKFKRSPLSQFQNVHLKYAVWNLTTCCNFSSLTTTKNERVLRTCDCICIPILQKVPGMKFYSNLPPNTLSGTPNGKDALLPDPVKFKNRKISIVTKSNDPDTFGDMEDFRIVGALEGKIGEESDFHEDCEIFIPEDRKYRSARDYLQGMKVLVKEKKLKQALELFLDMKRHLIPPIHAHYTFMIGACGRAGYTEMAFKLLRQMTDKGFKPTPATLTGLFNSCAESPNIEYALKKAHFLKEKISLKSWEAAPPTYRAMIKAFGRCGDIQTAFEVMDEMIQSGFQITVYAYNSLLISCISDKDAGFTHAIEVWRKMISKKLRPDLYSYNLLLRAVRDCGAGPEEVAANLLQHWSSCQPHSLSDGRKTFSREDVLSLPRSPDTKLIGKSSSIGDGGDVPAREKIEIPEKENMTVYGSFPARNDVIEAVTPAFLNSSNTVSHTDLNLLLTRPTSGPKLIDLAKIKNSYDRLLLIGGLKGILKLMKKDKVSPDMKTFTMLLRIIPGSTEHENELLSLIDSSQVKPDIDFFNILIKNRNFRKDFKAAKEVLVLITRRGLHPDVVTFGVLALGCTRKKDGLQLIRDMKNLGFCPNIEIFGALLNSARKPIDFDYICCLLKAMKTEKVEPSVKFLEMLENVKSVAHTKILEMEQGKEVSKPTFSEKSYTEFCQFYEQWLKTSNVEEEVDPWLQYKTEIVERVRETPYNV